MTGVRLDPAEFLLRPATIDDACLLYRWRTAARVAATMRSPPPPSFEAHLAYLTAVLADPTDKAFYILCHYDRPIGHVGLMGMDCDARSGEWTIYIGEDDAPAGSGSVLGLLAIDAFFTTHSRRELNTQVIVGNDRSVRLHERLGFDRNGIRSATCAGEHDEMLFRLTADQWAQRRAGIYARIFAA